MHHISNSFIINKLTDRFGETIIKTEEEPLYKVLEVTIKSEKIVEVLKFLFDYKELEFQFLTSLFTVHYPDKKGQEFQMIYLLHNLPSNTRIRIKTYLPKEKPEIDSAIPVFLTANWMERESYDFFGIIFKNHPNLKRILNVEDMDYFPMRKEYALEEAGRTDKDDTMFGR